MNFLIIILLICLILYFFYVKIVKARNMLNKALSGIDVQLEKRYALIPNVLKIAQKFMTHEKAIFTQITELRTKAMNTPSGSAEKFKTDNALQSKISDLMVSVENYPDLKSSSPMVEAIKSYEETENNIAAARRFYNTALRQLHDAVMIFPVHYSKVAPVIFQNLLFLKQKNHIKKKLMLMII